MSRWVFSSIETIFKFKMLRDTCSLLNNLKLIALSAKGLINKAKRRAMEGKQRSEKGKGKKGRI